MMLLERHTQLAELVAAQRDAAAGRGSVVVVAGAAGIGKTALVRQFTDESGSHVLWGLCDDLITPRPLGPLRDMFAGSGTPRDLAGYLDIALAAIDGPPHPTIGVIDDAHWADQATLDAIRFIGRRIGRTRGLLVVTYRDDEVPADHPLRLALGAIPPADTRRIRLQPLSRDGVAAIAGDADADHLYELTGGNPFFLHEVLASPDRLVPLTVQDAVLARVNRLDPAAVATVETTSVVPARAERWLLEGCDVADGLDGAVAAGVLNVSGGAAGFVNELARRAVEDSLAPRRREQLNRSVLAALVGEDVEPARIAHHAVQANDRAAVVQFAPEAARRAAALDSHRSAVAHYEQALAYGEEFPPDELADLLEGYARSCRMIAEHRKALDAVRRAVELTDNDEQEGRCLSLLAEVNFQLGRRTAAEQAAASAAKVLEHIEAQQALAEAYAMRARLLMMSGNPGQAIEWGERARSIARARGDDVMVAHIDVTLASVRWRLDPDDHSLVASLEAARRVGATYALVRAYANLAFGNVHLMRYDEATTYIDEGLALCEEVDNVINAGYLLVSRTQSHFEQGRWHDAEQDVQRVLDLVPAGQPRVIVLWVRGLIQARCGDPAAADTLAEMNRLALDDGFPEFRLRALSAFAELAYLGGDDPPAIDLAEVLDLIGTAGPWSRGAGDTALWLYRAGVIDGPPAGVTGPRALQLAGRWRAAAAAFECAGRRYDQADALADAERPKPLLEALEIFNRLGASARAALVRRRLADLGVSRVPRGPQPATLANPAGLTQRQTEVLVLLADDLTFQEIAERLHLSVKTVDHHVAAIRTKLAVNTRDDAVEAGRRLGIVPSKSGVGGSQT